MSERKPLTGRGAVSNPENRFARTRSARLFDDWNGELDALPQMATTLAAETARSIITRNTSPDVPFEQSINPYRGCEHGCVYCFARTTHSYLDLSPGLDFETRLFYKHNACELLEAELRRPGYVCKPITLGINTDAYQPIERRLGLTRRLLALLLEYRHPVSIVTKGITILRDLDLLEALAGMNLVSVMVSLTTLDNGLKRIMEPRTASPAARLKVISALRDIGIAPGVLVAPVIPAINDQEIEAICEASAEAGAAWADYVLIRLPHELSGMFCDWLHTHFPERAEHVMSLIRQMRGGRAYDSRFGVRMSGTGPFAELLARRLDVARRRHGLNRGGRGGLDCSRFRPPKRSGDQLTLI
ncbi:MAG: PA0069 family radical SAM protein [Wenzhouxiangellaceae bacterium]